MSVVMWVVTASISAEGTKASATQCPFAKGDGAGLTG
jgi:hypothetical protein